MSWSYSQGRQCACSRPIGNANVTGKCKPCFVAAMNTDPERARRAAEGQRRRIATDPAYRAMKARVAIANRAKSLLNPEIMARARQLGHESMWQLFTPEAQARRAACSGRKRLAWLPDIYRADYRRMIQNMKMKAPEARRIIEDQIAADKAREVAKRKNDRARLSPFERQEADLHKKLARGDNPFLADNDQQERMAG